MAVPLLGALLAWQWQRVRYAYYCAFPQTLLPQTFHDIYRVHFSPDGTTLLTEGVVVFVVGAPYGTSGTRRHRSALWAPKNGLPLWDDTTGWNHGQDDCRASIFSRDGRQILADDVVIPPSPTMSPPSPVSSVAVPAPIPKHTLYLYDAVTRNVLHTYAVPPIYRAALVDGDEKILCFGSRNIFLDVRTGKILASESDEKAYIQDPSEEYMSQDCDSQQHVNADGKTALLSTYTGLTPKLHLWDTHTAKIVATLSGPGWTRGGPARQCSLSPDGRYGCSWAIPGGEVELWDIPARRKLSTTTVKGVITVYFSPDSRKLLVSTQIQRSRSYKIKWNGLHPRSVGPSPVSGLAVYQCAPFKRLWSQTAPPSSYWDDQFFSQTLFSRDSREVITAGGRHLCWFDAATGEPTATRPGSAVLLSPDGKKMVVSTQTSLEIKNVPTIR